MGRANGDPEREGGATELTRRLTAAHEYQRLSTCQLQNQLRQTIEGHIEVLQEEQRVETKLSLMGVLPHHWYSPESEPALEEANQQNSELTDKLADAIWSRKKPD